MLMEYPSLKEHLEEYQESILHGYRQTAVAGGIHSNWHADPTAEKAIRLVNDNALNRLLPLVGEWIDKELPQDHRPFLLSVWRWHQNSNWFTVAKKNRMGVKECQDRWKLLVESLLSYLVDRLPSVGVV